MPDPSLHTIPDVVVLAIFLLPLLAWTVVNSGESGSLGAGISKISTPSPVRLLRQRGEAPCQPDTTKSNSKAISGSDGFKRLLNGCYLTGEPSRSACGLICLTNCPELNRRLILAFTERIRSETRRGSPSALHFAKSNGFRWTISYPLSTNNVCKHRCGWSSMFFFFVLFAAAFLPPLFFFFFFFAIVDIAAQFRSE